MTPSNLHSDWILFEAGALSKTLQNTYVCPFLIGLEPSDVKPPLAQFQATKAEKGDVLKLLKTLNSALVDNALQEGHIDEAFDVWWPKLESQLSALPTEETQTKTHRPDRELLEEILALVRNRARDRLLDERIVVGAGQKNPPFEVKSGAFYDVIKRAFSRKGAEISRIMRVVPENADEREYEVELRSGKLFGLRTQAVGPIGEMLDDLRTQCELLMDHSAAEQAKGAE